MRRKNPAHNFNIPNTYLLLVNGIKNLTEGVDMSDDHISEDLEIIQDCLKEENIESYGRLVKKYQSDIARQVRWYAKNNPGVVEELTHEVFVQAYFSLGSFSGKSSLLYWLKKIARRVCYSHLREVYKQKKHTSIDNWDIPVTDTEYLSTQEAAELLYGLLDNLPPEDSTVLISLYIDELSVKEIADQMDWNIGMVKMRVFRAKKKVRKMTTNLYGPEKAAELLACFC